MTRRSLIEGGILSSVVGISRGSIFAAPGTKNPRHLDGTPDVVHATAISGDGNRIAAGCDDGSIVIWDASSGHPIRTIAGTEAPIAAVALDSDGSRVASSGRAGFRVVDDLRVTRPGGGGVGSRIIKRRGRLLVIWTIATGRAVHKLEEDPSDARSMAGAMAFSNDDGLLAAIDAQGVFTAWDTATGRRFQRRDRPRFERGDASARLVAAFDGSGLRAAAVERSGQGGRVRIWDLFRGLDRTHDCSPETISHLALSRDGRRLATATWDHQVAIWEFATGKRICHCARDGRAPASSLAFSRDGRRIASGGDDGMIRVWSADDGRRLRTIVEPAGKRVRLLAFVGPGLRAVSG